MEDSIWQQKSVPKCLLTLSSLQVVRCTMSGSSELHVLLHNYEYRHHNSAMSEGTY